MTGERTKAVCWYLAAVLLGLATIPAVAMAVGLPPLDIAAWRLVADYVLAHGPTSELKRDFGIAGFVWFFGLVIAVAACPYALKGPSDLGNAAWATKREWLRFKRPGVTGKRGVVLGRAGGRVLMSDEPLSTMVAAPAGTGKTDGVIVPTILASDGASLLVNDVKGELYERTAGYRATLGPVYRIEYRAGAEGSACFNPIDPSVLPPGDGDRGDLVDRLSSILIPGKEGDFWTDAPQAALSAALLFHIYDSLRRDVTPTLRGALQWLGELGQHGDEDDELRDPVRASLERAADIAVREGYPARVALGLRQFSDVDARTRSNISASISAPLRVFLNDAVASVTSRTDFQLTDLRGVGGRPVTIYVVVPAFEQERFGKLTALLVESATRALTSRPPHDDELPVRFILDEVGFMPAIRAVSMGPAITRGYRVGFVFAFQDYSQIVDRWGQGGLDTMKTNTAYKIILTQNHRTTAEDISASIGKRTRTRTGTSRQRGLKAGILPGGSTSRSEEGVPLILPQDIMSLEFGHQLVLVQGKMQRPIACRSGFYKDVRRFKARAAVPPPVHTDQ